MMSITHFNAVKRFYMNNLFYTARCFISSQEVT